MNRKLSRFYWWCSALGLVATVAFAGCDIPRETTDGSSAALRSETSRDRVPRGPAEVARLLNELHRERAYDAIGPYIVAPRREAMLTLLRAIDDVFAADVRLREVAIKRFGGPHAVAWDLSVLRNNLGLFSADTHVINQTFAGDRGMVTLQEGDHVPLVRAPFVCVDGKWLYEPDMPPSAVTGELEKLADVIDDIRMAVEGGEDFGPYLESFHAKVLPQMEAVVMAKDEAGAQVTAAGEDSE